MQQEPKFETILNSLGSNEEFNDKIFPLKHLYRQSLLPEFKLYVQEKWPEKKKLS